RRLHSETLLERTQSTAPTARARTAWPVWPTSRERRPRYSQGHLVVRLPAFARKYHRSGHFGSAAQYYWPLCSGAAKKLLRKDAMQFGLNESQEFLRDSARKFFAGECPMAEVRRLMETDTAFGANLWSKLAEQGYTGIIFPEEFGGVALGIFELILLMEEAGRALLPGPFFSTVVMAGTLLDALATTAQKRKYLAPICRGEARATVAFFEAEGSWDLADVRLTAANGELKGEKLFVPDAAIAEWIIVVAHNGVFLVDSKASGVRVQPMLGMDLTRKLYSVRFDDVPGEKIGETAGLARPRAIATAA